MGNSGSDINFTNMKLFVITIFALGMFNKCRAADITVNVDMEELDEAEMTGALMDRTVVCQFFGNGRCATACAGQLCTSTCQARCGLFRTATYTCSAIAASTCSAGR